MIKVLLAILTVIIGVSILCILRWKAWFGNPDEPAYDIQHTPSRILLTMGNSDDSRFVTWQYDSIVQPGWLDYYENGSSDTITLETMAEKYRSRAGVSAFYSAELRSLKNNTSYSYRIRTLKDTTRFYHFSTDGNENCSFLYFGDVQDELSGGFDAILPSVMANNADADFLLFGGDLIERPMDRYWDLVFSSLDTFATCKPVLCVTGNHEYIKGVTRKLEDRFGLVFAYFKKNLNEYDDAAVYTFSKGNVRFFFLDSNKDFWKLPMQRDWLKHELGKSSEKWKIVVLHHPLISTKGRFNNLMQRFFFNDVVEDASVDLVLQGHEHVYARFTADTNGVGDIKSPLRLVSYTSEKSYLSKFEGEEAKWGTDDRYYHKVVACVDTLSLSPYNGNHELYDRVLILKRGGRRKLVDEGTHIPEKIQVPEWFRRNKRPKRVKQFEDNVRDYLNRRNPAD